jgi:hypothetical protein
MEYVAPRARSLQKTIETILFFDLKQKNTKKYSANYLARKILLLLSKWPKSLPSV